MRERFPGMVRRSEAERPRYPRPPQRFMPGEARKPRGGDCPAGLSGVVE
jgi:hypothetical protein